VKPLILDICGGVDCKGTCITKFYMERIAFTSPEIQVVSGCHGLGPGLLKGVVA
jgi:hypothetical protein